MFRLERDGHVGWVVMDWAGGLNTMAPEFFGELRELFHRLGRDEQLRVVVVRGSERAFSAGLDLLQAQGLVKDLSAAGRRRLGEMIVEWQQAMDAVAECSLPVIAAVTGACLGGGLDLACACDIRLCSRDAVFSVRETRMAMVADLGSLQRLRWIVGEGWARHMVLSGADFSAEQALGMGLVTGVYDSAQELWKAAGALAAQIAANSPLAVQGAKEVMNFSREFGDRAGLKYVAWRNAALLPSNDLMEALQAFSQRRAPRFTGS